MVSRFFKHYFVDGSRLRVSKKEVVFMAFADESSRSSQKVMDMTFANGSGGGIMDKPGGQRMEMVICWLLGNGCLLAWNSMLTMQDYYEYLFPDYHPARRGISRVGCSGISPSCALNLSRYHFAGTKGVFYSREPYSNHEAVHVTRFVGLAPVGNKEKQKFIHAISPTPAYVLSAEEISNRPPNTTLSPFTTLQNTPHVKETTKQPSNSDDEDQYWRYDVSQNRQRKGAGDGLCFKFISSGDSPRGEK
ncbi:hypothetical protein MKW98_030633 [Papaver atlanticum]|uniref:Uncharacterized protein n=1 Tax=Papaver atlanticum TaxID=357466 RepID=A0AAD4RTX0_9MAGN|nr:hypothetical protein MKW98_030633 [Papaver atlanticum]